MSTPAVTPQADDVQYIKLPDGSYGKFRSDADDATIQGAIEKDFPGTFRPTPPHSTKGDVVPQPKMETSVSGRMFGGPTGDSENSLLPSPKGQMAIQTKPDARVGALALGGGAATLGAAALGPVIPPAIRLAAKHPLITSVAIGEARHLPYVGKFIPPYAEMLPLLTGGRSAGKAIPEAAAAPEAEALGKIPVRSEPAIKAPTSAEAPAIPLDKVTAKQKLENLLLDSMGGKKMQPRIPLREQMPATKPAIEIPEGHTPVESSAVRSFKYDPGAKEFHAKATSGDTVYVYGDVSPEEAQSFEQAESKGKAWQAIRRNPLVAKIINGKRVAVRP